MRRGLFWLLSGLILATLLTLAGAKVFMNAPFGESAALARFLLLSSIPSTFLGYGLFRWWRRRLTRLRWQIFSAYGIGLAVALVNVTVTALLMFISLHDIVLLGLLLAFAAVHSIFLGLVLASTLSDDLARLAGAAAELADGKLSVRVEHDTRDEVGELARNFNEMASRLETAFTRQKQLEEARRDLVAAVSHDLRTPLAAMQAMIEALADGLVADPPTVQRYLLTLDGQIQSLSGLIDDLFELSQLDSGQLEFAIQEASLMELTSQVLESFHPQAAQKRLRFVSQLDPRADRIPMDPQRMERVLYNLVQNAIRHTPADGTITLVARPVPGGVQVDVIDTGEGIPNSDLPHVFERFYRGEKSRSRDEHRGGHAGSGLGLAIAKGIIEAHGGHIWVESPVQDPPWARGCKFSFILPLRVPAS